MIKSIVLFFALTTASMAFELGQQIPVDQNVVCNDASYFVEAMDRHAKEGRQAAQEVLQGGIALGVCTVVEPTPDGYQVAYYQGTVEERVLEGTEVALIEIADTVGNKFFTLVYK
jgi:hypothetical protein